MQDNGRQPAWRPGPPSYPQPHSWAGQGHLPCSLPSWTWSKTLLRSLLFDRALACPSQSWQLRFQARAFTHPQRLLYGFVYVTQASLPEVPQVSCPALCPSSTRSIVQHSLPLSRQALRECWQRPFPVLVPGSFLSNPAFTRSLSLPRIQRESSELLGSLFLPV